MESKGELKRIAEEMHLTRQMDKEGNLTYRPKSVKELSKNEEAPILRSIFGKLEDEKQERLRENKGIRRVSLVEALGDVINSALQNKHKEAKHE